MPEYSIRSRNKLDTCDTRIIKVFLEVIKKIDHVVLWGHRGKIIQDEFYKKGTSKVKYPNSKHNHEPSLAIDVAPWPVDWKNIDQFRELANIVQDEADRQGVELIWGGSWGWDYGHFEIKGE